MYERGMPGTMTADRIKKLNEIGFVWNPRKADQKPKAVGSPDTEEEEEVDDDDIDDNGDYDEIDGDNIDWTGNFTSSY
jgi:hypothetical protein